MKERPIEKISEEIIDYLEKEGSCYVKDLLSHIGGRTNKVIKAKDYLVKKRRIKQERDLNDYRKIKLSLIKTELDISLKGVMSSLPLAEKRVKEFSKKVKKPLFIHVEVEDGQTIPFKIKPRNKKILDEILQVINDLAERSVALSFAESMRILPKGSSKIVRKFQRDCIKTMRKLMNYLENEFAESEMELGSYLYYYTHGYRHLSYLEFLNRK